MTSPEPEQEAAAAAAAATAAAAKPEMPKAVNKPVEVAAATAAKATMEATKAAEATTAETKTATAEEATEPAAAPRRRRRRGGGVRRGRGRRFAHLPAAAAALSNMDEPIPFTNLNEALVKADTAGVFASPSRSFVDAKKGLPSGRNGVVGAPGAVEDPDEVKLAAMRKVAAQRLAQRKAYEALAAEREATSAETTKVASENPLVFLVKFVLKVLLSPVIFLRWLIGLFARGRASEAK